MSRITPVYGPGAAQAARATKARMEHVRRLAALSRRPGVIRKASKAVLPIAAILALAGCSLAPDKVRVEYEHVSHLSAGWPYGPREEEAVVDTLGVVGRWDGSRGYYIEAGVGVKLRGTHGGGLYGPSDTATLRVGREFIIQKAE